MQTIKFFFFLSSSSSKVASSSWHVPTLFWQLRAHREIRFKKATGFLDGPKRFFSRFSLDFLLSSLFLTIHKFDTFTKTFNHGRTSRKQQQQQQQRHHQQQLRERESERAARRTLSGKKYLKVFERKCAAREILRIKIWIYKNGDERLR